MNLLIRIDHLKPWVRRGFIFVNETKKKNDVSTWKIDRRIKTHENYSDANLMNVKKRLNRVKKVSLRRYISPILVCQVLWHSISLTVRGIFYFFHFVGSIRVKANKTRAKRAVVHGTIGLHQWPTFSTVTAYLHGIYIFFMFFFSWHLLY